MSSLFSRIKSATTSPKQTDWSCPQCTFHNRAKNAKCEMCDTVRPTQSSIFQLKIQVASGKPIELHVEKRTTIGSLKNLLEPKVGIPAARQKLFLVPRSEISSDDNTKMEHAIPAKKHRDQITIVVEEKASKKKPEKTKDKSKEEKKQKDKEKDKDKEKEIQEIEEVGSRAEDSDVPTSQDTSGDGHSEIVAPSIVPDDDDGEDWTADPPAEGDEATEWDDTKFLERNQVAEQSLEEKAKVQKTKETSYSILTEEEVIKEQNVFKKEVDDVLGVPLSEATVLLRHYRWKKDKLFEDWCKDQEKVRKACGLRSKERKEIGDLTGDFDCPFCLNTQPLSQTLALACGHRFCEDCWTSWLTAEMEKGPQAVFTSCPQFKCGEMVPEDVFLRFVKGKQVELLTRWLMRNFIEGNDNLKWCPGEGCSRAVKYEAGGQKDIECVCGKRFCFNCGDEAHQPCPCHLVALWAIKNKSDKENTEWITAFTKMCPKCKVHIEKNQGCNHMTCRNCKFEFCWLCKGDWKQHGSATGGFYSCNTYETQKQKGALSSEELKSQEAQNSLNKYIFYYKRYTEYEKAIVFAQKTSQQCEERMHVLQAKKGGVNIKSVDFLHQAIQTVIQCRRALKWSYVIGYYLKIGSSKQLFEDDQGHLEQLADKLHGMVERPLDELLSEKLREEIISLTNATKKYQQNLADGIMGDRYEDGLPK